MAAVQFMFGGKPGLTSDSAAFVAGLLETRATPTARALAGKLRSHAEAEHLFERVTLSKPELAELLATMNDLEAPRPPSLERLRVELETVVEATA